MKKVFLVLAVCMIAARSLSAQKTDSVIINVGEKSKVIFAIGDKADLQTLKQYDFQAVVNDLVSKLENKDTTTLSKPAESYVKTEDTPVQAETTSDTYDSRDRERERDREYERDRENWDRSWEDRRSDYNSSNERRSERKYYGRRTYHSFNFDLGTNNYVTPDFEFPNQNNESYSVRPWGSWYVGINSVERTRLSRRFFLEWGLGISWYNFKFENDNLRLSKGPESIVFSEDPRDLDFRKSKLTTTYLNASFVPVFDFGGRSRKAMIFDNNHGESFRIGIGPYAGYRIDSYTKLVYRDEDDDNRRERDHDSYYLNNIRYGVRFQIGFRATDLFINYDMNELFASGKGPKLNAFSFGLTF